MAVRQRRSCHHAFESVTPLPRTPACGTAERVEKTATLAGTHSWEKGHLQATEEDNSKQVRVEFGQRGKSATPTKRQDRRGTSPKAFAVSEIRRKSYVSRWAFSDAASCCLRAPASTALHAGGSKPITPSSDRNETTASWRQGV